MSTRLARLLHLADSALPTGGFAYSYGLESSRTFGLIRHAAGLRNYLYSYLQQVISLDVPFLSSCFALDWPTEAPQLRGIVEEYDAMLLVPGLHRASLAQSKNWLQLLGSFYPESGLDSLRAWFSAEGVPLHFVPVLALALRRLGYSCSELHTLYLHLMLRDQISAAIRLGCLGPMEGHRLQHNFYSLFDHLLAGAEAANYHTATRSATLLDAAQILHEQVYSRLFQN
ncbi:hypothetical protein HMJ29_10335 [Hymenobacter taeanensis]|uniref:Urease accessory protein UreF n=1 Tax=Hymenobacter taeanensis TaxID=2735321 RepID=A0A6M6BJ16_9BACT|nr:MULTISPECIES: urease accessory UreF family protein [Hymenobacter]QJX47313.1 hypothetical protein HMJ29_10335 [Hymenobacter taeanensis]UOQ79350.1 hypothetical protein MUN83_10795 [Hymenobacter sp. 5414T-23]